MEKFSKTSKGKICPECNRKMKQHVIGLFHCKYGMSSIETTGFFERIPEMGFGLKRMKVGNKIKHVPVIKHY